MIALQRTLPDDLVGYRFLSRRFPTNNDFAEKYRNLCAGLIGELLVDKELDELVIDDDHFIFRNYESKSHTQRSIQIDTLYVSKKFILTLEAKNITGHVRFDQMQHQFIRTKDSGEMVNFTNPVNQSIRHQQWLQQQLLLLKIRLPIISAVVFTNPSTIISSPPSIMPIFHLSGLRYELPKWNTTYKDSINDNQLLRLKNHFHKIYNRKAFAMPLDSETITKRVFCLYCQSELFYFNNLLRCPQCKNSFHFNFIKEVLNEYRIIWGEAISVQEFASYFCFRSTKSAYRVIKQIGLQKINSTKQAKYLIPTNIEPSILENLVGKLSEDKNRGNN